MFYACATLNIQFFIETDCKRLSLKILSGIYFSFPIKIENW